MTTTLFYQVSSFKFYDSFSTYNKAYYKITIAIKLLQYEDGSQYYDIIYRYNYDKKTNSEDLYIIDHMLSEDNEIFSDGVIVFKNEITTSMIKYLLMPDEELSNFTNNTATQHYRKTIMFALKEFWD
jgi:uncharacterized surface anchored protein